MSKLIVIIMFPERGALNASFQLASDLKNHGYDVLYISTSTYMSHIKDQGFKCEEFDLDVFYNGLLHEQAAIKQSKSGYIKRGIQLVKLILNRNNKLEEFLDNQFAWLDDRQVNLLLIDPILMNCTLPFLKRSIPIIHLNTTFAFLFNWNIAHVFSKRIPTTNFSVIQKLFNLKDWIYYYFRSILKDAQWHWIYGLKPTRTLNTLKGKIEKAGGRSAWGEYGYRLKTKEIVLASQHLDFPPNRRLENRIYAGSCVFAGRKEFESISIMASADKPLLYCSLGSYSHIWLDKNTMVFNTIIEAMREVNSWDVIIQVGDTNYYDNISLPNHIQIVKFINQLHCLKIASVAVTHAGCSSFKECTYSGTPMLVIPWNNDGYGNAARVIYNNLGVVLDINQFTVESFKQAFDHVVESKDIHYSVNTLQKKLHEESSCVKAVDYIESNLKITK